MNNSIRKSPEELATLLTGEFLDIALGDSDGVTLSWDGKRNPYTGPLDIVTLVSFNLDIKTTREGGVYEKLRYLLTKFAWLLADSTAVTCVGLFRLNETTISFDVNVVVPKALRETTLAFAKWNGQKAIWDVELGECVDTGADGSRCTLDPESAMGVRYAAEDVSAGRVACRS